MRPVRSARISSTVTTGVATPEEDLRASSDFTLDTRIPPTGFLAGRVVTEEEPVTPISNATVRLDDARRGYLIAPGEKEIGSGGPDECAMIGVGFVRLRREVIHIWRQLDRAPDRRATVCTFFRDDLGMVRLVLSE